VIFIHSTKIYNGILAMAETKTQFPLTEQLIETLKQEAPLYAPQIVQCYQNNKDSFSNLSEKMLTWGINYLGDELWKNLIKGYCAFVSNVNRSQMQYEIKGCYEHSSYQEVYDKVYNNQIFMEKYHWGVYLTTFAWEHHLKLYEYFVQQFINIIPESPKSAIDLGSGSGVWSLLLAENFSELSITAIDISETSVQHAKDLTSKNNMDNQVNIVLGDALLYKLNSQSEIGISCFLIEHLETPNELLENLASNLVEGGYAFVTAALSAAEIDHIFEIKYESQLILMAEKAGFRVISSFSSAPSSYPRSMKFLPRSMAMVLQKKHSDIW